MRNTMKQQYEAEIKANRKNKNEQKILLQNETSPFQDCKEVFLESKLCKIVLEEKKKTKNKSVFKNNCTH